VKCLLDALTRNVEGILETITIQDDGFQASCRDQFEDFKKLCETFESSSLAEFTADNHSDMSYVNLDFTKFPLNHEYTVAENIAVYKQLLYRHIKKMMKETTQDYSGLTEGRLFNFIEEVAILNTHFGEQVYSKEWYHSSMKVIMDIADEIKEHRIKNPQHSLF